MSFQFVTMRGKHKPGDRVLYFPVDSIIPEPVLQKLGLSGKLAGSDCNRLKTILLRGYPSQGLVEFPDVLLDPGWESLTPEQITAALGVVKYDPEANSCPSGDLLPLPDGLSKFDIEGADRHQPILEILMDMPVCVTEKIEGTNFSVCLSPTGEQHVCQRDNRIVVRDGIPNPFHALARSYDLHATAAAIADRNITKGARPLVAIYAEAVGPKIQGNYYKLLNRQLYVFGVKIGHVFVSPDVWRPLLAELNPQLPTVPVLASGCTLREWLAGRTLKVASNGKSVLNPNKLREGVVVEPLSPQRHPKIGRLILKQRDPVYLGKTEN